MIETTSNGRAAIQDRRKVRPAVDGTRIARDIMVTVSASRPSLSCCGSGCAAMSANPMPGRIKLQASRTASVPRGHGRARVMTHSAPRVDADKKCQMFRCCKSMVATGTRPPTMNRMLKAAKKPEASRNTVLPKSASRSCTKGASVPMPRPAPTASRSRNDDSETAIWMRIRGTPLPVKNDALSDGQSPDARDRAVDPRVVLVGTNHGLQHFGGRAPSVRIEVHHRAANVAHGDGDGGGIVRFAEREHAAQPFILLEGDRARGSNNDIRTKSSDIWAPPRESADLAGGIGGDHGDARLVEDTLTELHHVDGGPIAAPDLRGQSFSEQGHLLPLRRKNACRQRCAIVVFTPLRSEEDEVG